MQASNASLALTHGLTEDVVGAQIGAWTGARPNFQGDLLQIGPLRR